ncbi:transmembrane protein 131-like [Actinia tenebrosa]|uniref:Transmembrane protein 131-like n=1 Tax=Actinia tenebrosa TaxID=6105 RepID=A0A6P8IDG9_ACTTE|nr:transmembrane protein 131-like [Actinia tenebrosa]
MVIYDAAFPPEVESLFSIINFTKPAMISPQKTSTPFYVQFLANGSDTAFSTILRVYTNASIFTIPIHCYDGKVKYIIDGLEEDIVDYGTVGTREKRTKLLKIYNTNPVEVTISKITCNVDFASVKLLDVRLNGSKNNNNNTSSSKVNELRKSEHVKVPIKPNHVAFYDVELTVPAKEGRYSGEFEITTNFEVLHVPIYFKAMEGKVSPSPQVITFEPCFPGRIESQTLSLTSTFSHPVKLLSVIPHPADPRFTFVENSTAPSDSISHKLYRVGSIHFDPSKGCKSQCYAGLGTGTSGSKWLSTLTLPPDVIDLEIQYVEKLQRIYDSMKRAGSTGIEATFNINTDLAQGISLTARASLTWPSLAPVKPIKFPLTHIGNYSLKHFSIENPGDVPVVVQIVSLSTYPKSQGLLDIIADRFDTDAFMVHGEKVFSLPSVNSQKTNSTSKSLTGVTPAISGTLGVTPAPNTHVTVLNPRSKIQIPVKFLPVDDRIRSSIIIIRNNLTVLDAVTVQGQGARGEFMLNSKKPGLQSMLLFELRASHLSECHKTPPRSRAQPLLSVKKVLTATNPGQLAIFVSSLSIDGYECEGYGFKILNCKSFILNPNSSRKIEIAFTPDFTMSRVTRHLEVRSTFGPVMEFTLVATIPPHLLPLCASAIGLTSWEPYLQIVTSFVMCLMFILVVVYAYAEARNILGSPIPSTTSLLLMSYKEPEQVFDLNAIARDNSNSSKDDRQTTIRKKRGIKDRTEERPSNTESTITGTTNVPSSTNNNINKNTRQDVVRNRSPKPDMAGKQSNDASRKPSPSSHDSKTRNTQDRGAKYSDSYGSVSKRSSEYNRGYERDYKTPVAQIEELKQSIASVQEMETENCSYFVDSCKREFKDVKSKSKKKAKALNKREDKDSRSRIKERGGFRQSGEDEGGCSDDSGSEPMLDKMTLDVRMDQLNENRQQRRGSFPNDSSNSTPREPVIRSNSTQDNKSRARKNQVSLTGNNVTYKGKKNDNQAGGKSKALDLAFKSKDRITALQMESHDLGPTSPHAIAAAVMSQLEKSLQTSSNDNSYEEDEGKKRAFTKMIGSTNHLTDSPPSISPTNLSGSSRSSSYSSIVSDGSSSGSDQGKGSIAQALKQRLKPLRSMPLGDQSHLYDGGRQAQPVGFRKTKPSHAFTLSATKNSPWSTSADSALAPGSSSPSLQHASMSQFSPIPSSSLFESTPFNTMSIASGDLGNSPQGSQDSQRLPRDFSVFGVSDASEDARAHPSIWSSKPNDNHFGNPQSLFSSGPADETFQGKPVRCPNNWVNFLDNAETSPTPLNFKSVAEIWDSGSTPASDGWSYCGPPHQPDTRGTPAESEADPVDTLFRAGPSWASTPDNQEGTPFIAQETWGPAQVSSIWSEQYGSIPSSTTMPATSDSLTFQSMAPHQGVDSPEPDSPGGTFDAMSGFSSPEIWKQQPWSSGKY